MCCAQLSEKYETQKLSKKITICAPSHNFVGLYIFATEAYVGNWKKLLNSNISSTHPHNMANFGPLVAEIDW